uniref:Putative secreted protein n=1 Tax=Ixodes ricinus TaxID=34613 RepID=A0A6B0UAP8_IXORI
MKIAASITLTFLFLSIEHISWANLAADTEVLQRQLAFVLYESSTARVAGIKGWECVFSSFAFERSIKIASLGS